MSSKLGRRPSPDDLHVQKYPLRALLPEPVERVERTLSIPTPSRYRAFYVQPDGSCEGFSHSWAMSILNRRLYDAHWLYEEAKKIDSWPGENYDGTEGRAVLDVLKAVGHRRIYRGDDFPPNLREGIEEFRWATTVDEVRTTISRGVPVVLGIDWFFVFDDPVKKGRDWWLPEITGKIAGGHAICCRGASDRRQAVLLENSWGPSYPPVWVAYDDVQLLLNGFDYPGEASVITDRI